MPYHDGFRRWAGELNSLILRSSRRGQDIHLLVEHQFQQVMSLRSFSGEEPAVFFPRTTSRFLRAEAPPKDIKEGVEV